MARSQRAAASQPSRQPQPAKHASCRARTSVPTRRAQRCWGPGLQPQKAAALQLHPVVCRQRQALQAALPVAAVYGYAVSLVSQPSRAFLPDLSAAKDGHGQRAECRITLVDLPRHDMHAKQASTWRAMQPYLDA